MKSLFFALFVFFLFGASVFAQQQEDLYVAVHSDSQIDIYTLAGIRVARIEPTQGRVVYRQYRQERLINEQVEYRNLPPLPWFFTTEGTFFAFSASGKLRYYYDLTRYDEHLVAFNELSILQVIDDKTLLIQNANNQLALWRRTFNQESLLNLPLLGVESAQYLPDLQAIAYVVQDRFDYYSNPAMGSIVSSRYHQLIVQASAGARRLLESDGQSVVYDAFNQKLYFFKDKVLHYWQAQNNKVHITKFNFSYIPSSVAASWQQPTILPLPNQQYLIWARISARQTQNQLALYDGDSGELVQIWLHSSPQGALSLIKEMPK